jgi:glycosyltransferase involved in cell wall biosynthesis
MNKLVSVIIPTYKRDIEMLTNAIDSVLAQTYAPIEIIVINDNPLDQIIESQLKKYPIKYVQNPTNLGGAFARNEGIEHASGDYITFLDDDDIYLPKKIETQVAMMEKNGYDMVFTNLRIHNEEDKLSEFRNHTGVNTNNQFELLRYHMMYHLTGTNTFMYTSEAINKIGRFSPSDVSQEFYLMLKSIEQNLKIGFLNRADVINCQHKGERISVGANKLKGELSLYNLKKKYFHLFSKKDVRYIKQRFHLVIGVYGLRSKKPVLFVKHGVLAVLIAPLGVIRLWRQHRANLNIGIALASRSQK